MSKRRYFTSAVHVGGDQFLVTGGMFNPQEQLTTVELLSRRDGVWNWRTLAPLLTNHCQHAMVVLSDGAHVLSVGGWSGSSEIFTLPKDDKDVGQWTSLDISGSGISAGYVVFTGGRFMHFGEWLSIEGAFERLSG